MVCKLEDLNRSLCDHKHLQNYEKINELAIQTPIMSYKDGIGCAGPKGTKIDNDSFLKYHSMMTHYGGKNHIPHIGILTVPFMGCGRSSINYINRLESEYTYAPKSTLNRGTRNRFTPMVGNLATEIQNSKHIITEDNDKNWIRGGYPSRKCKFFKSTTIS